MGVFLLLGGVVAFGWGAILVFAGGQSDAPALGDAYASRGCAIAMVGLGAVIGGAALLAHQVLS